MVIIFYIVSFSIILLDQILKTFAKRLFLKYGSLAIIGKFVYFTYVENRGAAFGLLFGRQILLISVGILVLFVIFYYHLKISKRQIFLDLSLSLIFGGSASNLLDRILKSFVVDYIDIRIWPVFNLGDVAINLGVLFLLYCLIFKKERNASNSF